MTNRDGASQARSSLLLAGQNEALRLALESAPLEDVLEALAQAAETQSDGSFLASILLLDEDGLHLRHGAAPSLPRDYNAAIDGIAIGPRVGSCGTAAYHGHAIFVVDIETDPLWADFRELALAHGLRACWSTPFFSRAGAVLGTFALYYRVPRGPSAQDHETVKLLAATTGLIVENLRLGTQLRDLHRRAHLAADAAGLGFFTWDVKADTVSWQNARPYEMFGIAATAEPINARQFVEEFLHPNDQAAFAAAVQRLLDGAPTFEFTGRIRRRSDGELRTLRFSGQLDAEAASRGRPRVVGIAADVSEFPGPAPA